MNRIIVQLEDGKSYGSGSAVHLVINDAWRSQLGFNIENYARTWGAFDQDAAEFAYFTSVIYGCDRAVNRESSGGDRWTREFSVQVPVSNPEKWSATSNLVESMLEFLTGDVWHLAFVAASIPLFGRKFRTTRNHFRNRRRVQGNAVSLYSGGLDSLIGVIDWLEDNPTSGIVLASTYDAQAENSKKDQNRLLPHLQTQYPGRIQHYVARTGLSMGGNDINFRSRSLAFIGNAVLGASFLGNDTSIIIPENGAIALNYPLTPARSGSLSTRTVHPYFITTLGNILDGLGLRHPLINPYHLKTKGEMMQECRNKSLLQTAYTDSASCGKRARRMYWENRRARQCGVCVPCIFRRTAVHSVNFPEEQYGHSLRRKSAVQKILSQPNHDLSSVIDFIDQNDSNETIWRTLRSNGPLDSSLKNQYCALVVRLRNEVRDWVRNMELV